MEDFYIEEDKQKSKQHMKIKKYQNKISKAREKGGLFFKAGYTELLLLATVACNALTTRIVYNVN